MNLEAFIRKQWQSICVSIEYFATIKTGSFMGRELMILRDELLEILRTQKIATIDEITKILNCSARTFHRRSKQWRVIRSCNKNGKFYTLSEIPKFDQHGLWRNRGVLFSNSGNLKETVIHLIESSPAGIENNDFAKSVGLVGNSPIFYQLRSDGYIQIVRILQQTIFFSSDSAIYTAQLRVRKKIPLQIDLKCEDALAVFVELINSPSVKIDELVKIMHKQNRKYISAENIIQLFDQHGLSKKKKSATVT